MAHWRKKETKFEHMYQLVEDGEGLSTRELARRLDVAPFHRSPLASEYGGSRLLAD